MKPLAMIFSIVLAFSLGPPVRAEETGLVLSVSGTTAPALTIADSRTKREAEPPIALAPGDDYIEGSDRAGHVLFTSQKFGARSIHGSQVLTYNVVIPITPAQQEALHSLTLHAGNLFTTATSRAAGSPAAFARRTSENTVQVSWNATRFPALFIDTSDGAEWEYRDYGDQVTENVATRDPKLTVEFNDGVKSVYEDIPVNDCSGGPCPAVATPLPEPETPATSVSASGDETKAAGTLDAARYPYTLLVSGGIAPKLTIHPAFTFTSVKGQSVAAYSGPYTLKGKDTAGNVLFAQPFGASTLSLQLPITAVTFEKLHTLTISGPAGSVSESATSNEAAPVVQAVSKSPGLIELTWDAAAYPWANFKVSDGTSGLLAVNGPYRVGDVQIRSHGKTVIVDLSDRVKSVPVTVAVKFTGAAARDSTK